MENLSTRKGTEQDISIARHTLTSLKEKVESQNNQILKLNSDYAVKKIESDQLEKQLSDYKIVVADAFRKLEQEKNVLDKLQKTVWKERFKFDEHVNDKDKNDKHKNVDDNLINSGENNKKFQDEYFQLQGEINSLKFCQAATNKKIEEMKNLINDLHKKKENLILSLSKLE